MDCEPKEGHNLPWLTAIVEKGIEAPLLPTSAPNVLIKTDEVVRLILDTLTSLGYSSTASALEKESGISTGSASIAHLRDAVISGDWAKCLFLLASTPFAHVCELPIVLFVTLRQQYLELLESGAIWDALLILREQLVPLATFIHGHLWGSADCNRQIAPLFVASPKFPGLWSEHKAASSKQRARRPVSRPYLVGLSHADGDTGGIPYRSTHGNKRQRSRRSASTAGGSSSRSVVSKLVDIGRSLFNPGVASLAYDSDSDEAKTTRSAGAGGTADADGTDDSDSADMFCSDGEPGSHTQSRSSGGTGVTLLHEADAPPSTVRLETSGGPITVQAADLLMNGEQAESLVPLDSQERSYLCTSSEQPAAICAPSHIHALATLTLPCTPDAMRAAAHWSGAQGDSRMSLLHLIERRMHPSVVPPLRLPSLLGQALSYQKSLCLLHNTVDRVPSLLHDHICGPETVPSHCPAVLFGHKSEVWGVHFSPDGQYLASYASDGEIIVWDVANIPLHHSGTFKLDANAAYATAAKASVVRIDTTSAPKQIAAALKEGEGAPATTITINAAACTEPVSCLAWSANGRMLLSVGSRSTWALLWHVPSGRLLCGFDTKAAAGICGVAWISSGESGLPPGTRRFVTAGSEGGVLLWEVPLDVLQACTVDNPQRMLHHPRLLLTHTARWDTGALYGLSAPVIPFSADPNSANLSRQTTTTRSPDSPVSPGRIGIYDTLVVLTQSGSLQLINCKDPNAPMLEQDVHNVGHKVVSVRFDRTGRCVLLSVIGMPVPPPTKHTSTSSLRRAVLEASSTSPTGGASGQQGGERPTGGLFSSGFLRSIGIGLGLNPLPPPLTATGMSPLTTGPPLVPVSQPPAAPPATSSTGNPPAIRTSINRHVSEVDRPEGNDQREYLVLWDLAAPAAAMLYKGHKNVRLALEPCFGGANDAIVAIGSEDALVYIWHRDKGVLVRVLEGHAAAVTGVSWSPVHPALLASSSDDGTVRMWCAPPAHNSAHGNIDVH